MQKKMSEMITRLLRERYEADRRAMRAEFQLKYGCTPEEALAQPDPEPVAA